MPLNRAVEEVALRHDISTRRARKIAPSDLLQWSAADVDTVLIQIHLISKGGDPCGLCFNTCVSWPWWIYPAVLLCIFGGGVLVLPAQVVSFVALLLTELPQPTVAMGAKNLSFVKTPLELVRKAVEERAALCINKYGNYKIMTGGYAVMLLRSLAFVDCFSFVLYGLRRWAGTRPTALVP